MPELKYEVYYFSTVQEFVEKFKLKRLFRKLYKEDVESLTSHIGDILYIKNLMKKKFCENLWNVIFIPEIMKIQIIIYR